MLPKLNLDLTTEQQFMLQVYQQQIAKLSLEDCGKLLLETITQNMMKDNVIKNLLRADAMGELKSKQLPKLQEKTTDQHINTLLQNHD